MCGRWVGWGGVEWGLEGGCWVNFDMSFLKLSFDN